MPEITLQQLNQKLEDHILQHNIDNEKIMTQLKEIAEIISGAKFIPVVLKFLLLVGAFVGMILTGLNWLKH